MRRLTPRVFNADKGSNVKNEPSDLRFVLTVPLFSDFLLLRLPTYLQSFGLEGKEPCNQVPFHLCQTQRQLYP